MSYCNIHGGSAKNCLPCATEKQTRTLVAASEKQTDRIVKAIEVAVGAIGKFIAKNEAVILSCEEATTTVVPDELSCGCHGECKPLEKVKKLATNIKTALESMDKDPSGIAPGYRDAYRAILSKLEKAMEPVGAIDHLFEEVKKTRDMPFLEIGMRVQYTYNGKTGKIIGALASGVLEILEHDGKNTIICHPKWMMRYYGKDRELLVEYDADNNRVFP